MRICASVVELPPFSVTVPEPWNVTDGKPRESVPVWMMWPLLSMMTALGPLNELAPAHVSV